VEEKGAQLQSFLPCFSPLFFHSRKPNRWQRLDAKNEERARECPISDTLTKKQFGPTGEITEYKGNLVWAHLSDVLSVLHFRATKAQKFKTHPKKRNDKAKKSLLAACSDRAPMGAPHSTTRHASTDKGVDGAVALKAMKKKTTPKKTLISSTWRPPQKR
jgi:hypothetical protein